MMTMTRVMGVRMRTRKTQRIRLRINRSRPHSLTGMTPNLGPRSRKESSNSTSRGRRVARTEMLSMRPGLLHCLSGLSPSAWTGTTASTGCLQVHTTSCDGRQDTIVLAVTGRQYYKELVDKAL